MKSKWNIYIGSITIFLAIIAIAVAVTTPEIRCRLGLEPCPASTDSESKEVPVLVRTESLEPIESVNVEFTSKRGITTGLTDSNGYVLVKILGTRDLQITLRKEGFVTKSETVDLKQDSVLTKEYRLKRVSSTSQTLANKPTTGPVTAPPTKPSSAPSPPSPVQPPKVECKTFGDSVFGDGEFKETILVANKPEQSVSRFFVTRNSPRSVACQIQKNFGELPLAYALPENSELDSIVAKVYIDGKLLKNIDLNRGEALREKIDIKGASTYKVEFSVPDKSDKSDAVYVLEK